MQTDLIASYRRAEAVARSCARNFYYSFIVLPAAKRRSMCAVYAFMRYCDDISDGQSSVESKKVMLQRWREQLNTTVSQNGPSDSIFPAFRDSLERFSIPAEYFSWVIDGAEMDLTVDRYETFEDLYRYCFHVASAVGLVCLQIFGYKEEAAKKYAEYCGIAFQLTNILRDIKEDAEMGRIYLPREDLERFHYTPDDLRHGVLDERFHKLMAFQADRAAGYYAQARKLLPLVESVSRPALWAMIEIYSGILNEIVRRNYNVFASPIHLSNSKKALVAFKALAMRLRQANFASEQEAYLVL
jgi:15-cis-phytoene synthase